MNSDNKFEQSEEVVFQPLSEEYLEQSIEILYQSFKTQNPLWQIVPSTFEEVRSHFHRRALASIPKQTSYIALKNNKVVCCIMVLDFQDYLENRKKEVNIEFPNIFKVIGQAQGQFFDVLSKEQEPRKCLYVYSGGVDPQGKHSLIFAQTFITLLQSAKKNGYQYLYGFITSPRMLQLGSPYLTEMNEVALHSNEFPQVNGYKFYFAKYTITNLKLKNSNPIPSL